MESIAVKLTSKFQATVPKKIRETLKLEKGNELVYEILDDNTVILRKAYPIDVKYLESVSKTLTEWELKEDEQAYRNL